MAKSKQHALCVFREEVAAVFAHYRTFHPQMAPNLLSSSREWKGICARLQEGFTVEDLCGAIDGCHRSPFHCGENDRGKTYQSLELIVRDAKHVQEFLEVPARAVVLSENERRTLRAGEAWLDRQEASE